MLSQLWIETGVQDFGDGDIDPLLYVSRRLQVESTNPADSGAIEFYPRFDVDLDGYYDLTAGTNGSAVYIFYGGPEGYADPSSQPARADTFPVSSLGNSDIADLNLDGYPELVHSGYSTGVCRIYWGTPSGPDPSTYTDLPNDNAEAVFVYDLDRDGYLDIILGGVLSNLIVYWGEGYDSANMYEPTRQSTLTLYGMAHNLEVADLNKDGFPDIIATFHSANRFAIVWGDADRDFSNNTVWFSNVFSWGTSHGLTVADLNNDDWLDIVTTGHSPAESAYVYWNDYGVFSDANRTALAAGNSYGGSAAYDFNGDGWLDLIFFNNNSSSMKVYLNTGSFPYFSESSAFSLGVANNRSGGTVGDFNLDGKPDVYTNNYRGTYNYIYWGVQVQGDSLVYDSLEAVSSPEDHHGSFREPGNIYNRSTSAYYSSGVFSDTANPYLSVRISWIAGEDSLRGAWISFEARVSEDGSVWSDWFPVPNGNPVAAPFPFKFAQYRATFHWSDPAFMPWLERVEVEFVDPLDQQESELFKELITRGGKGFLYVVLPSGELSVFSSSGRLVKRIHGPSSLYLTVRPGVYFLVYKGKTRRVIVF